MNKLDIILIGGGLSNSLIAWCIKNKRPEINFLLIESKSYIGGNNIWSFNKTDLNNSQYILIKKLINYSWKGYKVIFPEFNRKISNNYYSICSKKFSININKILGKNLLLNSKVIKKKKNYVKINNNKIIKANCIIDGRGINTKKLSNIGYQIFLGQKWKLSNKHGLSIPILMDANIIQKNGYNFFYILPLNSKTLFIEYTKYTKNFIFEKKIFRKIIKKYAKKKNWSLINLEKEESGCLPIILSNKLKFFDKINKKNLLTGMKAGLFHATTGYSIHIAIKLAENIINTINLNSNSILILIKKLSKKNYQKKKFFIIINKLFFLIEKSKYFCKIIQYFYILPENTIQRFYSGKLNFFDKIKILIGKSFIPLFKGLLEKINKG